MATEGKRNSLRQERTLAKKVAGQLSPGSGSGWRKPNDVRSEGLLWEMKYTGKKQITVKADDLEQLRLTAILEDRVPVFHIEVGGRRAVILLEDDYLEMLEKGVGA